MLDRPECVPKTRWVWGCIIVIRHCFKSKVGEVVKVTVFKWSGQIK
jgi:hypothetical protein